MYINDIIGTMPSIILDAFMGVGNKGENYSPRKIIWQPTINVDMHFNTDIEKC